MKVRTTHVLCQRSLSFQPSLKLGLRSCEHRTGRMPDRRIRAFHEDQMQGHQTSVRLQDRMQDRQKTVGKALHWPQRQWSKVQSAMR